MRIENEAAYVLEARPYRETSLLIEAFTAQHGRVALVARGIRGEGRRQSARRAALEPFRLLRIGFSGRGDVVGLTAVEPDGPPLRPVGLPLFAGLYVNELVQKLTGRGDAFTTLFARYSMWLAELSDLLAADEARSIGGVRVAGAVREARYVNDVLVDRVSRMGGSGAEGDAIDVAGAGDDFDSLPHAITSVENGVLAWSLRRFERDLLSILGYALALDHDSDSGEPLDVGADYALDPDHGARPWAVGSVWPRVRGSTLLAWAGEHEPADGDASELKRLARFVIRHRLGGTELRAWKLARDWRTSRIPSS